MFYLCLTLTPALIYMLLQTGYKINIMRGDLSTCKELVPQMFKPLRVHIYLHPKLKLLRTSIW